MTIDSLKKDLMNGAALVFAKRLNEKHTIRACFALVFDRRKGYHIVEQSPKQVRKFMEDAGIYLIQLKDEKMIPVTAYGDQLVHDIPEESEEDIFQQLPRYDFTAQVQTQRMLKRIGFF